MSSDPGSEPAPDPKRLWLRLLISLPVLAGAGWVVFGGTDKGAIWDAFAGVSPRWIAAAVTLMAGVVFARVWRWGLMVRAVQDVPWSRVVHIGCIGLLAIDIMPVRTGEFVRPALLKRQVGVPFGAGLATCIVERVFDLIAVLVTLLLALTFAELPSLDVTLFGQEVDLAVQGRNAVLIAAGVLGLPGIILVLAGDTGIRILARLLKPWPEAIGRIVMGLARSYQEANRSIGKPGILAPVIVLTGVGWSLNLAVELALLQAFGITSIGVASAAIVMLVIALALMLPSPAGALGVFEAGAVAGLLMYGVDHSLAAAFGVALHALHVGVIAIFGLFFLGSEGLRIQDLWRR